MVRSHEIRYALPMCGRYSITTNPEAMRRLFKFKNVTPNDVKRWAKQSCRVEAANAVSSMREKVEAHHGWRTSGTWIRSIFHGDQLSERPRGDLDTRHTG